MKEAMENFVIFHIRVQMFNSWSSIYNTYTFENLKARRKCGILAFCSIYIEWKSWNKYNTVGSQERNTNFSKDRSQVSIV